MRISQTELNEHGVTGQFDKQNTAVAEYLGKSWRVSRIQSRGNARVVGIDHPDSVTTFALVLPNGRVVRNRVGQRTIPFNWADVAAAARMA